MQFKLTYRMRRAYRKVCDSLDRLQSAFFACYLMGYAGASRLSVEAQIEAAQQRLFAAIRSLRNTSPPAAFLSQVERLYETVFSFGHLRLRVSDPAVFTLCQRELSDMTRLLSDVLLSLPASSKRFSRQTSDKLAAFAAVMTAFEDVYQGALRITAPEPLVFLFFLSDMTAFRQEVEALLEGVKGSE